MKIIAFLLNFKVFFPGSPMENSKAINNIPALVQIMAWRRLCDRPLSEPMIVRLPTHIRATRPEWVNIPFSSGLCELKVHLKIPSSISPPSWYRGSHCLTNKDINKIVANVQTIFSHELFEHDQCCIKCHLRLFVRAQLAICHHWIM